MKFIFNHVDRNLSLKLSLGIMLFLVLVFTLSLGGLFLRSRQLVKQEAIARAEIELDNMAQRVDGLMRDVEIATQTAQWHLQEYMVPDSLVTYVGRIVKMNPNFDGCSVALKPYYFPERGRYFSVYAYNRPDTVVAKIEPPYNYFEKPWYKTSATLGKSCWEEAYLEDLTGAESAYYSDMVVSYCMPMYDKQKSLIGVISTDLSMPWLSNVISRYKPYKNSFSIMLGADGQY